MRSKGNQAQTFRSPIPLESYRTCLIPPAVSCQNTCEVLPAREARQYSDFLFGAGHVSTSIWHVPKISNSQQENRCSAINYIVCSNHPGTASHSLLVLGVRETLLKSKGQPRKEASLGTVFSGPGTRLLNFAFISQHL